MYPAIFSRTYPARQIGAVLQAIHADGFRGAQMNLSSFGLESLPAALDESAIAEGRELASRLGIAFAALSGTYNMAHPDADVRKAMRPRFENVLRAAQAMGAPIVSLCTGSRDAGNMWHAHPQNASAKAWSDMRGELEWALDRAAACRLTLAIEPEPGNVVRDARVARRLLDEVKAPHLKIILDAANLIGADGLPRQREIIEEAADLLGADVVLAHAKDIDAAGTVVAPGQGAVDLTAFVAALRRVGFDGALIGHGFEAADTAVAGRTLAALCATPS